MIQVTTCSFYALQSFLCYEIQVHDVTIFPELPLKIGVCYRFEILLLVRQKKNVDSFKTKFPGISNPFIIIISLFVGWKTVWVLSKKSFR